MLSFPKEELKAYFFAICRNQKMSTVGIENKKLNFIRTKNKFNPKKVT